MGKIIIDDKRVKTMAERLGDACNLIDDKRYYPFFRKMQKLYPNEFKFAVGYYLKNRTKDGSNRRCFATMWRFDRLEKTLIIIRSMIEAAKAKVREVRIEAKKLADQAKFDSDFNSAGRERYEQQRSKSLRI